MAALAAESSDALLFFVIARADVERALGAHLSDQDWIETVKALEGSDVILDTLYSAATAEALDRRKLGG